MIRKVMLADDQQAVLELVEATIGNDGSVEIRTAGDGDEAAGLWHRLLEKLPPGSAKRAMVEQAIESLAKK